MDGDRALAVDVAVGLIAAALRSWRALASEASPAERWLAEVTEHLRAAHAVAKGASEGRS